MGAHTRGSHVLRSPEPHKSISHCFLQPIGELLGKGKHGSVYAAGPDTVVKIVRQSPIAFQEAEIATRIGKKKIGPSIRQVTRCNGKLYIYMEKVTGTLRDWMEAETRSRRDRANAKKRISKLFQRLHSLGLYHGDVHWENIAFIRKPSGKTSWKLIDFGWVHSETETRRNRPDLPLARQWWGAGRMDVNLSKELNNMFSDT